MEKDFDASLMMRYRELVRIYNKLLLKYEESKDNEKYWSDLVKDIADNMDNSIIKFHKGINAAQEIIMKYSDHRKDCDRKNADCTCGYFDHLLEFHRNK